MLRVPSVQSRCRCSGTGIQQQTAFHLRSVRLVLLDREHESRENHGTQNSRCKPNSIAIESADRVPFHLTPFVIFVSSVLSNGF